MATGDVIVALEGDTAAPRAAPYVLISPRMAAAEALAAYLRAQTFYVWEGEPEIYEISPRREVQLVTVYPEFPDPTKPLEYPSASIADLGGTAYDGGFTPSVLEDTYEPGAGTVVWCLGWASGTFQLDLWADSMALRDALAAQIAGLLNPRESQSGVTLQCPPTYACAAARFLLTGVEDLDPPDAVYANERRARCTIAWQAPLLDKRKAVVMRPETRREVTTG